MGGDVIVANCTAAAFVENENLPFLAPFFRIRGTDGHKLLICIYLINNTLKCKIIATEILMFQYILIIFVNCRLCSSVTTPSENSFKMQYYIKSIYVHILASDQYLLISFLDF